MRALTGTERWGLVGSVNVDPQSQVGEPPREAQEETPVRTLFAGGPIAALPNKVAALPDKAARRRRVSSRLATVLAGGLAVVLLALWLLPPLFDWNRYRSAIAGFAAAELGRPVTIGGNVTLRLLPAAVLTADDVTFPDQGNGVSVRLRALRLEVAILPLLGGHLVVRDLTLGEPLLKLPWPLPPDLDTPIRPYVRHAFTATVERGSVQVGRVAVTGIDAAMHSDAATGALSILGVAALAGSPWRFTTSLGAPDADGNAALVLAVDGQGQYEGTQGRFAGSLAPGLLSGRIEGLGPDLSRLLPAPKAAWHAQGPFHAAAGLLEIPALELSTGESDVQGPVTLRITNPVGLEAQFKAERLDIAAWSPAIFAARPPGLPVQLTIDAAAVPLLGDMVHALHAAIRADAGGTVLEAGSALLPGGTALTLTGAIGRDAAGPWVAGPARLTAPDLQTTLTWLKPVAPDFFAGLPEQALRHASLAGALRLSAHGVSLSDGSGIVDGEALSGDAAIALDRRVAVTATVTTGRFVADHWLSGSNGWPAFDGDLTLRAAAASFHGHALGALDAAVRLRDGGLTLNHFTLAGTAGRLALSGTLGSDGSIVDGHAEAAAADIAALGTALAGGWGIKLPFLQTGLWQGGASLQLTASGPPHAWLVQARADAGDLLAESAATIDWAGAIGDATVTVRHPGAPRLLAALGAADAEHWLDTGSLALLAHLSAGAGHVHVADFDLTAARLRLSGTLDADLTGSEPRIEAKVDAPVLSLPWTASLPGAWFQGWDGHARLHAGQLQADLQPLASALSADLTLAGGALLVDGLTATIGDGTMSGRVAMDGVQPARMSAQLAFAGATLPASASGMKLDIGGGTLSGKLDVFGAGGSLDTMLSGGSGAFDMRLQGATVFGLDLPRLALLTVSPKPLAKPTLTAALTSGSSPGLSGAFTGGSSRAGLRSHPRACRATPAASLSPDRWRSTARPPTSPHQCRPRPPLFRRCVSICRAAGKTKHWTRISSCRRTKPAEPWSRHPRALLNAGAANTRPGTAEPDRRRLFIAHVDREPDQVLRRSAEAGTLGGLRQADQPVGEHQRADSRLCHRGVGAEA